MTEVLARFVEPVVDDADERAYAAQACAAMMPDGRWEGWIEFVPVAGGIPVRTPRETTQSTKTDAEHWASGLTPTYLKGALERALSRPLVVTPPPAEPIFDTPAPDVVTMEAPETPVEAVLDPFSVYEKGEELLRGQLGALSERHLVNILVAYHLSNEPLAVLNQLSHATLIDLIVDAVRQQT